MIRFFSLVLLCISIVILPLAVSASDDTEDNVLVVVKRGEVLAFSAPKNHWVSFKLHLNEHVIVTSASGNVAVVVTASRLLGFSVLTDKWNQARLNLDESVGEVQVSGNAATVETQDRVLGFSALAGRWVESP